MVVGLCPLAKMLPGRQAKRVYALVHKGRRWKTHSLPFSLELQATILPHKEVIGHSSRRMRIFGQDKVLATRSWVGRPESKDTLLNLAGIPAVHIPVVPAAQQFAEGIHAYTFRWQDRDNTRVKDLADPVLLVHFGLVESAQEGQPLQATFRFRATHPLMAELPNPLELWSESFRAPAI